MVMITSMTIDEFHFILTPAQQGEMTRWLEQNVGLDLYDVELVQLIDEGAVLVYEIVEFRGLETIRHCVTPKEPPPFVRWNMEELREYSRRRWLD